MGRYYYGDINGKFYFGIMDSRVAEVFGDYGENVFYCESKNQDILESEIHKLDEEDLATLSDEAYYIQYSYHYKKRKDGNECTNFKINELLNKIEKSIITIKHFSNILDKSIEDVKKGKPLKNVDAESFEKILPAEKYISKLKRIYNIVESRNLDNDISSKRLEEDFWYLTDFLHYEFDIDAMYLESICEVVIGYQIFEQILKNGRCKFLAEL